MLKERRVAELGKRAPANHEAELLLRIGRHDHVVGCHGHFWDGGRGCLYVVLDYAAGGDLSQLIRRRTLGDRAYFLPEDWVWTALEQMCLGLRHLHSKGVVPAAAPKNPPRTIRVAAAAPPRRRPERNTTSQVHRDVKALNVLVAPTSRRTFAERGVPKGLAPLPADPGLKIADLGVSRQVSEDTQFLRTLFGTPLYASPEICEGTPYDEKTDIWTLGVLLYELCALQPPFTARNPGGPHGPRLPNRTPARAAAAETIVYGPAELGRRLPWRDLQ